ncbi:MAG: pentapeptide repeat-containing protein [Symploca sp. SIO3C6]|nr:pentapeptide repeat-containing protein [Symploca sp. SIO3C6]
MSSEVLKRYNDGRRDFSNENLRGQSFQGKNLADADFSGADIRGANFTNAYLKGAKFCDAEAGLQRRLAITLVLASWILSAFSGIFSIWIGVIVALIFDSSSTENVIVGWVYLIVLAVFLIVTIRKGLVAGFGAFAFAFAFTGATFGSGAGVGAVAFAGAVVFAVAFAVVFAGAVAGYGAFLGAVTGAGAGAGAGAVAFAFAFVFALLGADIGWRGLAEDKKHSWVRPFAIAFAATGGTSFYNANLTEADFTGARLKSTDLRKANLTRTCWREATKLDRARVGDSIISNTAVRELLTSGNGKEKSYVKIDLRGANLARINLSCANLKYADLSEANLQQANLEWANLTETNAVEADFTEARLTGACLEAWNIDSNTKLEQVDCRFVYLLENPKPGTDDSERRPSSGEFQPGEFTKLFQEVLNTVDLIFRNGIDWKAFIAAFKKVQVENDGTELAIQSIENKGDGVVVVKVNVSPDADKEKIHSEFTQNYQLALQAVEEKYKAELQAKDREIKIYREKSSEMTEIVGLLAQRPIQNIIDVTAKSEGKVMNNSTDNSRKIENRDGNVLGNILGDSSTISGTVTQTINELPASPEADTPGIKELLAQLQTALEAETSLDDEDKAEALKQVQSLAEAGKNPSDGGMKKLAKNSTRMLKAIISELPTAAKLVETCKDLLPAITNLFGF